MHTIPRDAAVSDKAAQGRVNYHSGLAAEDIVARWLGDMGAEVVARRWRGVSGEVDLIVNEDGLLRFIEVKAAHTCAAAAERLTPAQIRRVAACADEYVGALPEGGLTHLRVDGALVDAKGHVEILENISMF